ncbi:hypothetical protein Xvie_04045 [Xenorhabdus vietnamensis]|uniref:Uncharacterized protein n=1 Tax=Xenorhabdus vietnamensis TaxID=351656 RepID=A0A1Y2S5X9_9GAMM|nr:hypothetical protein [Xenorhabdus vietnamensis]OTA14048.1 hypothetical protein Xvie_04045 [Xenorhabdus vietnamensis]
MINKLQAAVEIAEEIEASIFPVMTATQNEAESDTYFMCRGVHRQTCDLAQRLREINKEYIIEDNIDTDRNLNIELEPARNLIKQSMVLIGILIDIEKNDETAIALYTISNLILKAGKEIARVQGVEYS